jgi:uncharacterized paraquat-inducible protein A
MNKVFVAAGVLFGVAFTSFTATTIWNIFNKKQNPKPELPSPTALTRTTQENLSCKTCGEKNSTEKKLKRCVRCQSAVYCSATCAKQDWKTHKRECVPVEKVEQIQTAVQTA